MKTTLALVVALMFPAVVSAQTPREEHLARAAIIASGVASYSDVSCTMYLFGVDKSAYEQNAALRWATSAPWGLGLVKGGIAAGQTYALLKLRHSHPRWAIAVATGSAALSLYAVQHNVRLIRDVQAGR